MHLRANFGVKMVEFVTAQKNNNDVNLVQTFMFLLG